MAKGAMKLLVLLAIICGVHSRSTVLPLSSQNGTSCNFPGIPSGSVLTVDNKTISWEDRRSFSPGEEVIFYCVRSDGSRDREAGKSKCESSGYWNKHLPQCDMPLNIKHVIARHENGTVVKKSVLQTAQIWHGEGIWANTFEFKVELLDNRQFNITLLSRESRLDNVAFQYKLNSSDLKWTSVPCPYVHKPPHYRPHRHCTRPQTHPAEEHVIFTIRKNSQDSMENVRFFGSRDNHCGWPPVPVNGYLVGDVKVGSTNATYNCNERFRQTGGQSTCNANTGVWSDVPRCICPVPESTFFDFTRLNATHGQYKCKPFYKFIGFGINGSEIVTCNPTSGSWNTTSECVHKSITKSILSSLIILVPVVVSLCIYFVIIPCIKDMMRN